MRFKNLRIWVVIDSNIAIRSQDLDSRGSQGHGKEGEQDDGEFHIEDVVDRWRLNDYYTV